MLEVIVTGAAGFIGSHLSEHLLEKGHKVIGIDELNNYYDPTLKRKNINILKNYDQFSFIQQSIEALDWKPLVNNIDYIFHQAAQAGVRASWGDNFRDYVNRNILSTQILLESLKESKSLKKLVFASSSSVYGDSYQLPTTENINPKPISPYGITKYAAEQLCNLYYVNYGIPIVLLRYFSVYGPRQRPDMAFHKFFKSIIESQPITIYGNGLQTRDFTFVKDIVSANMLAAMSDKCTGEIINIGGGSRLGLLSVIEQMENIVGEPINKIYLNSSQGDATHTAADISKAKRLLGFFPQTNIKNGLKEEWEWIKGYYQN